MTTRRANAPKRLAPLSTTLGLLVFGFATLTPAITETAIANGDTRTIYLHHAHTSESIAATYLVNGQYDSNVLRQLNWFLRDWRRDEATNMDPRLFDVVWEAYRGAGAGNEVINVVSAYRSPETNAMLRARSRAVAKYSQHMLGKAMDTTMPGVPMSRIREVGMRMQRGGVGYYPTAGTPFVHLDVGSVRSWPRMTYDQLIALFPDGKTVHLPANGQPLARYEEARAEIEARGNGAYVTAPRRTFGGFLAMLFGGGAEEDDSEVIAAPPPSTRKQWASLAPRAGRGAKTAADGGEEGAESMADRRTRAQLARAEANLPRGETMLSAPGVVATAAPAGAEAAPEQTQEKQENERPGPTVRAPLPPPGRPASLDGKPLPLNAPTPPERPTTIAGLETAGIRDSRASAEVDGDESAEPPQHFVNAPLPPRRPATLVATASDVPLPPAKPRSLTVARDPKREDANAAHAIATLVEPAEEAPERAKPESEPLAYIETEPHRAAAGAEPAMLEDLASGDEKSPRRMTAPRPDVVPARLDRSNFHALTGAAPASRTSARSVMGAPIGAVRSAARAAQPSVLAPARPERAARFAAPEGAPPAADKFSRNARRDR